MMFISVITHVHPKKKVITRLETLTHVKYLMMVLTGLCPSMSISKDKDMTELLLLLGLYWCTLSHSKYDYKKRVL